MPNKDAITRALIRRELTALENAVAAIDAAQTTPSPLATFIGIAVNQQLRYPALGQQLEIEGERLGQRGISIPSADASSQSCP